MITKCKKCGCDTLIKNGEWYECPMCGTMMFDTSIFVGKIESPTKTLEMIDEGKVTATAQISKPFSIDAEENHEEKTFESTIEKAKNTTQEKPKKKKHTKKKAIEKIPYFGLKKTSRKKAVKYIGVTAVKIVGHEKHLFLEVYRNKKESKEAPMVRIVLTKKDFGTY